MPAATDLSKLRDVVKNNVVKKTDYSKLVTKVDDIDTSGLVKKTDYNTKITKIEGKIPDTSNLATKTALTTVANKFSDISYLATKTELTTVENKILDINSLVKKSDYNTKITGMRKYFKLNSIINVIDRVLSWQSKELSNENIKPPRTSDNSLNPELSHYGTKTRVRFTGSCFKQLISTYTHDKVVNIYIVYELEVSSSHISDPTIRNCLFGAVSLTKTAVLRNMDIQAMVLDSIEDQAFHFQVEDLVKMY